MFNIGDEIRIKNYLPSTYSGKIIDILGEYITINWYIHNKTKSKITSIYFKDDIGPDKQHPSIHNFYVDKEYIPIPTKTKVLNKINLLWNRSRYAKTFGLTT